MEEGSTKRARFGRKATFVAVVGVILALTAGTALAVVGPRLLAMNHLGEGLLNAGKFPVQAKTDFVDLKVPKPTKFFHVLLDFAPTGHSGWHTHPGPVIFTVRSGSAPVEVFDEKCQLTGTYGPGESFIDTAFQHGHIYRNASPSQTLRLAAVAMRPQTSTGPPFTPTDAPPCAAAAGLPTG